MTDTIHTIHTFDIITYSAVPPLSYSKFHWIYPATPLVNPLYLVPFSVFISNNVGMVETFYVYAHRDTFYEALAKFTRDGENARFLSDLVFAEDGTIEVTNYESGDIAIIVVVSR